MIWCCDCCEPKTRKDLMLRHNPYYFKNKAYCKKCGSGALIIKKVTK